VRVRTFIVRLRVDAGGRGGAATALRGVVDDVATGLRATFADSSELVTVLVAAAGGGPFGPPWPEGESALTSDRPNPAKEH
jgi:hypothetical protein